MRLIQHRSLQPDCWMHLTDDEADQPQSKVSVTLDRLREDPSIWTERELPWGVRLNNDTDPAALDGHLNSLSLITIDFPKFVDGRGYTLATLLRRAGYTGELRAIGDVLPDQIAFMERCGFDSFLLADGKDANLALQRFDELGAPYQSAGDGKPAAWRRFGDTADS